MGPVGGNFNLQAFSEVGIYLASPTLAFSKLFVGKAGLRDVLYAGESVLQFFVYECEIEFVVRVVHGDVQSRSGSRLGEHVVREATKTTVGIARVRTATSAS